jgi:hypothetical protein
MVELRMLGEAAQLQLNSLPSNRDALRHIFWISECTNTSTFECINSTAKLLVLIWKKVNLEVIAEQNVGRKLSSLLAKYKSLKKSKHAARTMITSSPWNNCAI